MLINFLHKFFTKERIEVFSLNAFALCSLCAFGLANIFILFFCIYALINHKDIRRPYEGSKIFYLFLIFAAYISISAIIFSEIFPETRKFQINSIYWWLAPWTFLIVAWLIRGRDYLIFQMLQFSFVGFLFRILTESDWSIYRDWLSGGRYGFGYPWLVTSLFCAVFLAGAFIFRDKILKNKVATIFYYFIGVPFILFVMAVNQSRGMFIVIALILFCSVLIFIKNIFFEYGRERNVLTFLFISVLSSFILLSQYKNIKNRFIEENYLYEKILKFDIKEIPYSSIGARIHFINYGKQLICERPFFGWGPGTSSTQYLAKKDNIFLTQSEKENLSAFSHLHNLFLEVVVRFGLVGFAIYFISVVVFIYFFKLKNKTIETNILNYCIVFTVLNLYFNIYDFRYIYQDYRNFLILYLGIFFSKIIINDISKLEWNK